VLNEAKVWMPWSAATPHPKKDNPNDDDIPQTTYLASPASKFVDLSPPHEPENQIGKRLIEG